MWIVYVSHINERCLYNFVYRCDFIKISFYTCIDPLGCALLSFNPCGTHPGCFSNALCQWTPSIFQRFPARRVAWNTFEAGTLASLLPNWTALDLMDMGEEVMSTSGIGFCWNGWIRRTMQIGSDHLLLAPTIRATSCVFVHIGQESMHWSKTAKTSFATRMVVFMGMFSFTFHQHIGWWSPHLDMLNPGWPCSQLQLARFVGSRFRWTATEQKPFISLRRSWRRCADQKRQKPPRAGLGHHFGSIERSWGQLRHRCVPKSAWSQDREVVKAAVQLDAPEIFPVAAKFQAGDVSRGRDPNHCGFVGQNPVLVPWFLPTLGSQQWLYQSSPTAPTAMCRLIEPRNSYRIVDGWSLSGE